MKILNNRIKIINYFINSISIEDVLKYILNFRKKKKNQNIFVFRMYIVVSKVLKIINLKKHIILQI